MGEVEELIKSVAGAGVAKWLKAQGLGPCHEGVRGFDSRPPHLNNYIIYYILDMELSPERYAKIKEIGGIDGRFTIH